MTLADEHDDGADYAHGHDGRAGYDGKEKRRDIEGRQDCVKERAIGHARGVDIGEVVEDDEHRQGQPGAVEEHPELARGAPGMDECEAEGKGGEKSEEEAGWAVVDAEAERADEESEGDEE
ncbi:MAG: hypothetical protein ACHQM4_10965 [Thermoanaerobaculia bacterium]